MRPNRQGRRLRGKSDPLDAYQAAESVLARRGIATPKARDGAIESLRVLRAERSSAMRARVAVMTQIQSTLVAAPESLRAKYRGLSAAAMIAALEKTRPARNISEPANATAIVLKRLAARYRHLHQELALIDAELDAIITIHAPMIRDLHGVGTDVASQLLVTVGDNPNGSPPKRNSQPSSVSRPSPHPQEKPSGTDSAAAVTGKPTKPSTTSPLSA